MTPLPGPLGGSELLAWRLDTAVHAKGWGSGEGASIAGGRWNSRGVRAVYCAVDPATAIPEVAVHKGFPALDTVPHILTVMEIRAAADVQVVDPATRPDPNWLVPGQSSAGQQAFGDALLAANRFVLLPGTVSRHSWNLIFLKATAVGFYVPRSQEAFALDPRLHPPVP